MRGHGQAGPVFFTAQLCAPHAHEHESCRQRVKQTALCDEHGEKKIFPCDVFLHRGQRFSAQQNERGESAGEKESSQGKSAPPSPQRDGRGGRAEESGPTDSFENRNAGDRQDRVPKIHAGVVRKNRARHERILGPEVAACRPAADQVQMQGHVAEVVRRENFEIVALLIDDPEKSTQRGQGENAEKGSVGQGDLLPRRARAAPRDQGGHCSRAERDPRADLVQAAGQLAEAGCHRRGDRNEDQPCAEPTPACHGVSSQL